MDMQTRPDSLTFHGMYTVFSVSQVTTDGGPPVLTVREPPVPEANRQCPWDDGVDRQTLDDRHREIVDLSAHRAAWLGPAR